MTEGIKYKYALGFNNQIVDIVNLTEDDRLDYECISCGTILRPVMGFKRKKHFRHKIDIDCSKETYLHRIGKLLFLQVYQECLKSIKPFVVEFSQPRICNLCIEHGPCQVSPQLVKYDLTRGFQKIHLETKDGTFIPDLLLLSDSGEKLYIEIVVTRFATEIKRSSGYKIIEILLGDENDLVLIKSCELSETDKRIEFINFHAKEKRGNFSKECKKFINAFILWPNGKSIIIKQSVIQFKRELSSGKDFYYKLVRRASSDIYIREIERAYLEGFPIKSCFTCRYNATANDWQRSENEKPLFCKFRKISCSSNDAVECSYFKPDKKVFRVFTNGLIPVANDIAYAATDDTETLPTDKSLVRVNTPQTPHH